MSSPWKGFSCRRWRKGRLTAADERKLPARAFGLPKQRKFPMPDRVRAISAKAYAKKGLDQGTLTKRQYAQIVRKADRHLKLCIR